MAATLVFGDSDRISKRAISEKAPKSVVVWSSIACMTCIVATIAVGFTLGGWVTGSKAAAMSDQAAIGGQAKLAAAICVDRFNTGPKAQAQIALLKSTEPGRRDDFLIQGGWLALPGRIDPVAGAADLCVQHILNSEASAG